MQTLSAKELRERHGELRRCIHEMSEEIVLVSVALAEAISPFAVGDTIVNLSSKARARVHKFLGVCDHTSPAGSPGMGETVILQAHTLDSHGRNEHLIQLHVFNVGQPYCMWIKEEK